MMTFSIIFLGLFLVFLGWAIWQLVIAPKRQVIDAMPGGISRLRVANMMFIGLAFGPLFGVLVVEAFGQALPGYSSLLATVGGSMLYAILATFGPLSALFSDAFKARQSLKHKSYHGTLSD